MATGSPHAIPAAAARDAAAALWRRAAALAAPPVCVGCRSPQRGADALALCPSCLGALRWIGADACRRCALPAHGGRPCPARDAPWATAWAPVVYAGPAAALVRALKFRGALPLLDVMAAQMATNLPAWSRPPVATPATAGPPSPAAGTPRALGPRAHVAAARPAAVVVPVPPDPGRRRRRGFDAAEGLASRVADRLGLPLQRALARASGTRQLGAGRAQRRAGGRLHVSLVTGVTFATDTVLLVDDVHTTGATLRAATRVLRDAGVSRVHAVTYARTR